MMMMMMMMMMFWRVELETVTGVPKNCIALTFRVTGCWTALPWGWTRYNPSRHQWPSDTMTSHPKRLESLKKKHLKSRIIMKLGLSGDGEFLAQLSNSKLRKGRTSTSMGMTWSDSFRNTPSCMLWWWDENRRSSRILESVRKYPFHT